MAELEKLVKRYRGEIEDWLGLDEVDDIAEEALLAMETAALLVAAGIRAHSVGSDDEARIAEIAEAALGAMTAVTLGRILQEPGIPVIRSAPGEDATS